MPILRVWLREWELGGGDYKGRVGELWDGMLVIHEIEDPSQVPQASFGGRR